MNWLQKIMNPRTRAPQSGAGKGSVPEGVWEKCGGCGTVLYRPELERNLMVCPKCGHHGYIEARTRLHALMDEGSTQELWASMEPTDPLKFRDSKKYRDRITLTQKKTGEKDALIALNGTLKGRPLMAVAFEFAYMGGSMGSVVGEKFVRGANACLEHGIPLVCFAASGGARMQESLLSLMQMAKTSAALAKMHERGLPFISVLTHPTMGGVSASFAQLGDIQIAEPNALIGFAGPRVIEQTVREKLPAGFQRAEFLKDKGAIDMIVDRREMRDKVHRLLAMLTHFKPPLAA